MSRKKVLVVSASCLLLSGLLVGCQDSTSGNTTESNDQAKDTTSLVNNQPPPGYNYSQIRQNLIDVENAEADGVQSTTFFFNQGDPDPYFTCPSIGAPIPVTASLTNPQQSGAGYAVTAQMDPNGVYTAPDSAGTNVVCIGTDGKATIMYAEGPVSSIYGAAVWSTTTHTMTVVSAPKYNFSTGKGN